MLICEVLYSKAKYFALLRQYWVASEAVGYAGLRDQQ